MAQVLLIKGDDPTLVAQALSAAVDELLGGGDRSLMVEEIVEDHYLGDDGDADISPLVNAAHTPPFLTEKRIVVGRNLGVFSRGEQVAPLVGWLENPLDTTDLIMVWEKGSNTSARLSAVPKKLKEAIKTVGGREIDAAPSGKGRKAMLDDRLSEAPVRLDPSARRLFANHLGDDVGRVTAILEALSSTFGDGASLTAADVEPFLGQASDVPPWELTDAIDTADIALALDKLHRMMGSGERHALQILATLHGHYQRALALDGAPVGNEKDAAQILGIKGSTFPAKKALSLSRKLGSDRLRDVMLMLNTADLDVRGGSAVEPQAVMDVLVARLARLSR